jgi:hypothetical protein
MEEFFNDLSLSTITVVSKLSNVKFKENILINHLSLTDTMPEIIKIGCNYGEYISKKYIELTTPVKKSNRGRKKKEKPAPTRKVQGNGKYFNSQITFTILDPNLDNNKFYHLKLYANGTIQITYVCYENIQLIKPIIDIVIKMIKSIDIVKEDINNDIEIMYIKSVMRNYKFNIIKENMFIDLNKFKNILMNFKTFQNNNKNELNNNLFNYFQNNENYSNKLLLLFEIGLIKCNFEKNTGIIVKFKIPIENNTEKETTVKIFSSGKINIVGSNSLEESVNIRKIFMSLIYYNKDDILYIKN